MSLVSYGNIHKTAVRKENTTRVFFKLYLTVRDIKVSSAQDTNAPFLADINMYLEGGVWLQGSMQEDKSGVTLKCQSTGCVPRTQTLQ